MEHQETREVDELMELTQEDSLAQAVESRVAGICIEKGIDPDKVRYVWTVQVQITVWD